MLPNDSAPSLLPAFTRLPRYYGLIRPRLLPRAWPCRFPACTFPSHQQTSSLVPLQSLTQCPAIFTPPVAQPVTAYTRCALAPDDSRTSPVLTESDEYRCFINRSLAFGSFESYLMNLPSPFPSRSAPLQQKHQKGVCRLWLTAPAVGQLPSLQQHVKEQLPV